MGGGSIGHFEKQISYVHVSNSECDSLRTVRRDTLVKWKPTRCTISQLYFNKQLYMFRTDLMSIIRSLDIVFTVFGVCHTSYVVGLLARSGQIPVAVNTLSRLLMMDSKSVRNM